MVRSVENSALLEIFTVDRIHPPAGAAKVECTCTFKIEEDAILTVFGLDLSNGSSNSLSNISNKGRLTDNQIVEMINEINLAPIIIDLDDDDKD
uniref:Uncharacterized protein n=1 Tax=Panagrolaimus davidi TaxID=227884 RepID=A0A914PR13_9BILA